MIVLVAFGLLLLAIMAWMLLRLDAESPVADRATPSVTAESAESPSSSTDVALQHESNESWGDLWFANLPDVKRPNVEIVRVVDFDEWAGAVADCLTDAGFVATAYPGHGIEFSTRPDDEAYAMAAYICHAQYPMEARYLRELTDAELGQLYDYWVSDLRPCLDARGIATSKRPPSRAKFIIGYENGSWTPYTDRLKQIDLDEFERIAAECPRYPSLIR